MASSRQWTPGANGFRVGRIGSALDSGFDLTDDPLAAPVAAWQCDLSDESLHWERGVFEIFGLPSDAPVERAQVVTLYCDDSREELNRLRSNAIATGGSFTFEAQIRRPDGMIRWVRITADTVVKDGRVTHLYGTKQDVTVEALLSGKFG